MTIAGVVARRMLANIARVATVSLVEGISSFFPIDLGNARLECRRMCSL